MEGGAARAEDGDGYERGGAVCDGGLCPSLSARCRRTRSARPSTVTRRYSGSGQGSCGEAGSDRTQRRPQLRWR